jgi:hypothetical protein
MKYIHAVVCNTDLNNDKNTNYPVHDQFYNTMKTIIFSLIVYCAFIPVHTLLGIILWIWYNRSDYN